MATHKLPMRFFFLLLLVFFPPLISAKQNFLFLTSPNEVTEGAQFEVSISLENLSSQLYDIKLFVGKDTKEYSEISFNEKWQSPFNYLKASFPKNSEYTLRANIAGETKVCVRLRPANQKSFQETCNPINVLPSAGSSPETKPPEKESSSSTSKKSKAKQVSEESVLIDEPSLSSPPMNFLSNNQSSENEKIILKSQIKNESSVSLKTNKQTFLKALTYSFIFFLILLIILLVLNKL